MDYEKHCAETPSDFARRLAHKIDGVRSIPSIIHIIKEAVSERDGIVWDAGYRDHHADAKESAKHSRPVRERPPHLGFGLKGKGGGHLGFGLYEID